MHVNTPKRQHSSQQTEGTSGHCVVHIVPNRTRANDGWDQQWDTFQSQD